MSKTFRPYDPDQMFLMAVSMRGSPLTIGIFHFRRS